MINDLTRRALSVAITTAPERRQQLIAMLPKDTFKGPPLYFNLWRFFATDTTTESFDAIAKATRTDPVVLAGIMAADESFRPLSEHLIKLLAAQQTAASKAGQDVTQYATSIARIAEVMGRTPTGVETRPLFISAPEMLSQPVEIMPLLGKVIERGCTGQLFGPSGGGKTFVALDMTLAVGTGGAWNGNQCEQGVVLYFAGEGHAGLKRRVKAWYKYKGAPDLSNVHISRSAISFEAADIRTVLAEVQALEQKIGKKVALVVIDTLARHIEGDENSTKDMTEFVRVVDGFRDAFPGSTALIIHHTGNNTEAAARSRGSSALKAACDFEIQCDKGLLTFTKVKDGEQPAPVEFKLVPVEIGRDDDDEPITSCVVVYGERSAKHQEVVLTAYERMLLNIIKETPGILIGDLRSSFYDERRKLDPEASTNTLKNSFLRSFQKLVDKQVIIENEAAVSVRNMPPSPVTYPSPTVTNDAPSPVTYRHSPMGRSDAGDALQEAPVFLCRACRSNDHWLSLSGTTHCRVCHPPSPGAEVMEAV